MKSKLKQMYATDFAKQASRIQEVIEIIQELDLNQALTEGTKLLRLILTIIIFRWCRVKLSVFLSSLAISMHNGLHALVSKSHFAIGICVHIGIYNKCINTLTHYL